MLREAADANGWIPSEIEGVLIGMSAPVTYDYVAQIARARRDPRRRFSGQYPQGM